MGGKLRHFNLQENVPLSLLAALLQSDASGKKFNEEILLHSHTCRNLLVLKLRTAY